MILSEHRAPSINATSASSRSGPVSSSRSRLPAIVKVGCGGGRSIPPVMPAAGRPDNPRLSLTSACADPRSPAWISKNKLNEENVHGARHGRRLRRQNRSEEHTSELQSLMRISYAVFCLKKKNITQTRPLKRYRHFSTRRETSIAPITNQNSTEIK